MAWPMVTSASLGPHRGQQVRVKLGQLRGDQVVSAPQALAGQPEDPVPEVLVDRHQGGGLHPPGAFRLVGHLEDQIDLVGAVDHHNEVAAGR